MRQLEEGGLDEPPQEERREKGCARSAAGFDAVVKLAANCRRGQEQGDERREAPGQIREANK